MPIRTLAVIGAVTTIAITSLAANVAPVRQSRTWTLGDDAETRQNPRKDDPGALEEGRALFKSKCSRCHGPGGLGDGPDADPELTNMNLTDPARAGRNPDGVVFYKILNGRGRPKMPAFKDELSEQQIWALVTYVQTLRKK